MFGRLIDAASLRQRVISQNIANINTPHYKRMDVDFEEALVRELNSSGRAAASGPATPEVIMTPGLKSRTDGNNVDMDNEIGQLNKNALLQQMYLQLVGMEIQEMQKAIQGG